jgi:4-alpha-glucanotransferase
MTSVKKYAESKKVFIMGDLPFLVSRDSADVWSDRKYFKLNHSSGAPPDMYFAGGQRWGMPPYNREELEKDGFTYITNKLKYAENFYDLFRIDHFVGFFRLWTIDINESVETGGLNGKYDPAQENLWEETGRNLVEAIIKNTTMLPCAEDLGTVPECSGRVLWDYGIPGIDVQRWMKTRDGSFNFLEPQDYRWLAAATVSTHDSSTIPDWWHNEAGTIDGKLFERLMREKGFTDIRINEIKENLFDADASRYDRLYWKEEIDSNGKMLNALGIPQESAWNITVLYNESYGEKKKYMEYIGKFNPLRSAHLDDINESRTFSGNDNLKVADTANNCISTVTPEVMESVLGKINSSSSIFSIQLLQEWLSMDDKFLRAVQEKSYRINFPGIVSESNWATVLPYTLERIIDFEINSEILNLNREAIRV